MHNFTDICGNEVLIKSFKSAVLNKKVSHSFIIEGGAGTGKKLISSVFAKTLMCEVDSSEPCGICRSCRTFDSGNHPDVIYVKPSKTKSLGVDDVREQINGVVSIKPYSGRRKIFIILDADEMTHAAQNALLKTLEEPPSYAVFILLAKNINSFLPTVLSRCAAYKIRPLGLDTVSNYLIKNLDITESKARFCGIYAAGSIGRAKEIAVSENFNTLRQKAVSIFCGIKKREISELLSNAKEIEEYKDNIFDILDIGCMWYRDLAVYKETGEVSFLTQRDLEQEIKKESEELSLKEILRNLTAITNATQMLKHNANFLLSCEVLFLTLAGLYE